MNKGDLIVLNSIKFLKIDSTIPTGSLGIVLSIEDTPNTLWSSFATVLFGTVEVSFPQFVIESMIVVSGSSLTHE